jgi:hypothetical protein
MGNGTCRGRCRAMFWYIPSTLLRGDPRSGCCPTASSVLLRSSHSPIGKHERQRLPRNARNDSSNAEVVPVRLPRSRRRLQRCQSNFFWRDELTPCILGPQQGRVVGSGLLLGLHWAARRGCLVSHPSERSPDDRRRRRRRDRQELESHVLLCLGYVRHCLKLKGPLTPTIAPLSCLRRPR